MKNSNKTAKSISQNAKFNTTFPAGLEDMVDAEKLQCVISVLEIFIPVSVSIIDEALMMFTSSPNNWQVFHSIQDWDTLADITKIERTVNFVTAMKDHQYRQL